MKTGTRKMVFECSTCFALWERPSFPGFFKDGCCPECKVPVAYPHVLPNERMATWLRTGLFSGYWVPEEPSPREISQIEKQVRSASIE